MCSTKYNETFNDEVRWTSGSSSRRIKSINDDNFNDNQQLTSAQPTVTSIRRHNNQSSSHVDDDNTDNSKNINFIKLIIRQKCILSPLNTKNKSILYQLILLYLVLNIICNTILTTLLPCVSADELMDAPGARGHYTPTWAVHIPGGEIVAQQVADDHGYVLLGKIIDDHYHFHHNSVSKRSISPSHHHQSHLDTDDRVRWSQQQRAKSRQKRDYVKPNRQSSSRYNNLLNDPKWPLMWYLNRGSGLDMNVIPAWKEGITGKGVVVTILDDGLESDHPDLIANYDPKASYDVNSHDDDPTPHYDMTDSNRHGTRCAGEVAATANNSECAVGIAFGARVGGVRMLDGDVTDAVEARSLSLNPQHIDIYSASWGPDDDGKTVDGPGEMATRAFIEGVTKGRGGKGSIFIWASGNGGREHDNCNCDGYTNSIWTLSISSATEDGLVPWYSEMCSSTLATTYSSGGQGEKQVVTTDLHHSCTASHTGTSASAPLAAGIAALVLEANANLTWRDLQHIVVRTAKPGNLKDPTWSKNGVGRRVSHSFGYGLMDAVAMVRLARTWKTVPDQQRCEINAPHLDRQIPPKSRLKLQLTVQHCKGVNYLEHVQAKITLTSQRRGDIQIYLTSPAGTKVTLLTSRSHDVSRAGFNNWPFMSVHTWGEAPHGHWQLEIFNEGRYMGYTMFKGWSIILYGTSTPAQAGDPLVVSKIPSPPLPTSFNSIITNNNSYNSYNYGTIYTKPPSNASSNNKNNKNKQFGYTPAYPSGGGRGGGKGNKNKNGGKNKNKGQQLTTIRPYFTNAYASPNNNSKNRIATTTTKPKTTISWNSLGNGWGKQQSLSIIPQKTAVKAPKQVKNNDSPPAVSPTVISRKNLNLFDHYDKIQQIFPELQPYQDTTNSMYNSNNKNNNNFDMTTATTASYASVSSAIVVVNNKPSRANSKMVSYPPSPSKTFDPDVEFIDIADYSSVGSSNNSKKNKGWSSNNNNMRTQSSRISSSQRNGNAQITQWELIFYGTEDPPQPGDPPRFGFDKSGLDSDAYDGEIGQNVLEFEPGTAGQWRDIQQVENNRIDVSQRTASNDLTGSACRNYMNDSKCIECVKDTFLYKDRCYSSCPEGSYIVPEVASIDKVSQKREKSLSLRYAGEEESLSELGDIKAELLIGPNVQKLCASCHFSCLHCRGPEQNHCIECVPNYIATIIDNETYCKAPAFDDDHEVSFIFRLNTNELMLLGGFLGVLVFIVILGGYFFFRNVCCARYKEYMYNPLNDDDQEMGRQTINKSSAVAFKREIQQIINDDSTSSDEDTEIYTSRRYDKH